ncbi:YkgJ family cysteine cluster protein [Verrucomicrobia bacterium]|nr:YkgJ family cysteine cluster protein [Verrucomicrobiota bacterium]
MPVFWECQRCGACCRWPGQVKVTDEEIGAIAAYLEFEDDDFIQNWTRIRPDRSGLALLDQEDGACIYYENGRCRIQEVKPQQCRDFPNLWSNPKARQECQAVPKEVPEDEYRKKIKKATGRDLGDGD